MTEHPSSPNDQTQIVTAQFDSEGERFIDQRRSNVKTDLIEITGDKLEVILLKHESNLGKRTAWITPLSLFVSVLLTLLTATFNDMFGLLASEWKALFVISGALSIAWLGISLIRLYTCWRDCSIGNLIAIIKNTKSKN